MFHQQKFISVLNSFVKNCKIFLKTLTFTAFLFLKQKVVFFVFAIRELEKMSWSRMPKSDIKFKPKPVSGPGLISTNSYYNLFPFTRLIYFLDKYII